MKSYATALKTIEFVRYAALCAVALSLGTFAASAATLSRSMEVNGAPATVWSAIGAFCAIKDWLPPVGMCIEDGKTPPTRTLVTKDGKASFVEKQTARNDREHSYSYTFVSSPLPQPTATVVTSMCFPLSLPLWDSARLESYERAAGLAVPGNYLRMFRYHS